MFAIIFHHPYLIFIYITIHNIYILKTLSVLSCDTLVPIIECYEENHSMAWGKPQQMEMTAKINSNIKYAI